MGRNGLCSREGVLSKYEHERDEELRALRERLASIRERMEASLRKAGIRLLTDEEEAAEEHAESIEEWLEVEHVQADTLHIPNTLRELVEQAKEEEK